ncbi:hypothetical protein [Klebsiella pneumoniae]|uniref:hypothetical protein n=1 Tax=Klebsiella pneumoniae TaxID=573 RepID=UPI0014958510|nr:hypothetical protein [Klebsiella pneumoniae]
MAVVLNGNTEIKYFPFHDSRSADDAEAMADEWRYQAIDAIRRLTLSELKSLPASTCA